MYAKNKNEVVVVGTDLDNWKDPVYVTVERVGEELELYCKDEDGDSTVIRLSFKEVDKLRHALLDYMFEMEDQ